MQVRRLVNYPYSVRIRCTVCQRAGAYRLARLAARFGSETLLDDRIVRLPADCAWRDDPPGRGCGAGSKTCRCGGLRMHPRGCASCGWLVAAAHNDL